MNKYRNFIIVIPLAIVLTVLVIFNIRNNANFFMISIGSLLTLFVAILISYYFVQRNTDQRYQKEIYVKLLMDIQSFVTNPDIYTFNKEIDTGIITSRKRTLSNYIRLIESHSKKFCLQTEVEFVRKKFDEYDELIGDHISDIEYLSKSKKELQRPLDLINDKLYEMMLKLYD